MADLRSTAQSVLIEAREGIAWIAFYKRGRGWDAEAFWPEYDEQSNSFKFEEWDVEDVKEILATDADAVFVNGYYTNIGPEGEMDRETLANALRWQYEGQWSRLADLWKGAAA